MVMIMLIDHSELSNFTCNALIPLKCEVCSSTFHQPKRLVLRGVKGTRKVSTCSNECRKKTIRIGVKNHYTFPKFRSNPRTLIKQEFVNLLGGRCFICGYNRSLSSLTFHHKTPLDKSFSICQAINKRIDKELILAEVMKCIILCSNCHGEYHDGILQL
jgi:hypothetical protein